MNITLYPVVVLYNKTINESQSIQALIKDTDHNIHLIVLDNSSEDFLCINYREAEKNSIEYYAMHDNIGLSKAYNYALNILKYKDEDSIVIWLDDDTPLSKEYLDILCEAAEYINRDVFIPIVLGQNGIIYSPCEVGFLKGKYLTSPNQPINYEKISAINSCLAVRLRVYRHYRYDESLFMDCVDTKLFDDFRLQKLNYHILPVVIKQNFFQRGNIMDVDRYWKRFQIRIKDTVTYSKTSVGKMISGFIRVAGWAVVYGIKLKSFGFFCKCFELYFTVLFT